MMEAGEIKDWLKRSKKSLKWRRKQLKKSVKADQLQIALDHIAEITLLQNESSTLALILMGEIDGEQTFR